MRYRSNALAETVRAIVIRCGGGTFRKYPSAHIFWFMKGKLSSKLKLLKIGSNCKKSAILIITKRPTK